MRNLYDYIQEEMEGGASVATPANTMGAGEPTMTDLVSAPAGGIPKTNQTRITKRKKRKKKGPDYIMTGPRHENT